MLSNCFGEVQSKCRLNVLVNPLSNKNVSKNAPCFVELLKDITVSKGQDVCFRCRLAPSQDDESTACVKWFKDGQLLKESNKIKVGFLFIKIKAELKVKQ